MKAAGVTLAESHGHARGGQFLAVQNGTNPPRIARFSFDRRRQEVLEANSSWLGEATHRVVMGRSFYFLASTGWGDFDEQGMKKANSAPVQSTVRRMPLL